MRRYRLLSYFGILTGVVFFFFTLYGITKGTTNFRVKEVSITYSNLPAAFDGFRIAQISDVHLGSFYYQQSVEKGISLLNEQKPDVILMTGDMVNVVSDEASHYVDLFKNLKPAYGKYAVLGNHDMGDYMKWDTLEGQHSRTDAVATIETAMGFTVLRNAHAVLHKNSDSIVLAGVDNWGLPPFKKYGNLNQALTGISPNAFTILLSHDPSHWDAEVVSKTKVALTLSGHTHAFQIGFDYGNIRWSPIFLKYKEYLGLYESGMQYLYVNPGFGFIGFAGRIGVPPEVTIITLRKKS
ncbi:MAG: metallophosphoesterase [Bacteroidota bacterium]